MVDLHATLGFHRKIIIVYWVCCKNPAGAKGTTATGKRFKMAGSCRRPQDSTTLCYCSNGMGICL